MLFFRRLAKGQVEWGSFRDYSEVPQWQLLPSHRAHKGSGGLRDCRIYHFCSGIKYRSCSPGRARNTIFSRAPSAYSRNQRFTVPRRLKRLRGSLFKSKILALGRGARPRKHKTHTHTKCSVCFAFSPSKHAALKLSSLLRACGGVLRSFQEPARSARVLRVLTVAPSFKGARAVCRNAVFRELTAETHTARDKEASSSLAFVLFRLPSLQYCPLADYTRPHKSPHRPFSFFSLGLWNPASRRRCHTRAHTHAHTHACTHTHTHSRSLAPLPAPPPPFPLLDTRTRTHTLSPFPLFLRVADRTPFFFVPLRRPDHPPAVVCDGRDPADASLAGGGVQGGVLLVRQPGNWED